VRQPQQREVAPTGDNSPDVEIIGEASGSGQLSTSRAPDHQMADGVEIVDLSVGHDVCVAKAGLTHHVVPSLTAHALEVRESVFDNLIRDIGAHGCTGSPLSEYKFLFCFLVVWLTLCLFSFFFFF
jgi:hypothetical protein